jgi:hypothetical protein
MIPIEHPGTGSNWSVASSEVSCNVLPEILQLTCFPGVPGELAFAGSVRLRLPSVGPPKVVLGPQVPGS